MPNGSEKGGWWGGCRQALPARAKMKTPRSRFCDPIEAVALPESDPPALHATPNPRNAEGESRKQRDPRMVFLCDA